MNEYCDLSVKNVKKNFKENQILRDINAPAAFAIGVVVNSSLPRRKKVIYANQIRKKLESQVKSMLYRCNVQEFSPQQSHHR